MCGRKGCRSSGGVCFKCKTGSINCPVHMASVDVYGTWKSLCGNCLAYYTDCPRNTCRRFYIADYKDIAICAGYVCKEIYPSEIAGLISSYVLDKYSSVWRSIEFECPCELIPRISPFSNLENALIREFMM